MRQEPKQLSGYLLATAGGLFFIAGLLRRLQEPLWLILGVVCIVLGLVILRSRSRG